MVTRIIPWIAVVLAVLAAGGAARADDIAPLVRTLQGVGPGATGNREAAAAWRKLVGADPRQLPEILAALDQAGPLAANWIRTAVETIAERRLQSGGELPAAKLEAFLLDRRHAPRARRLAYEWLLRVDGSAAKRLVPGMLDDPSAEMRRDAVAWGMGQAEALEKSQGPAPAAWVYRQALTEATDVDQIRQLAQRLAKLGQPVDLPRQLGMIVRWKLIGPFDNTGEQGFDRAFPPERDVDPPASLDGKHGPVRWIDHTVAGDSGQVDFNRVLGMEKAVVGYAATVFVAEAQREVEFRMASFNAVKLWLNGRLIDKRNVYHNGSQMDQYVCRAALRPGRNAILVKVCQNSQRQDWAVHWWFQLRVCDDRGRAVLSVDRDTAGDAARANP